MAVGDRVGAATPRKTAMEPASGPALRSLQRPWRSLKVFAFDPSRGRSPSNIVTLQVPYEPLKPGPVGRSVAVVDSTFDLVKLDSTEITLRGGLDPSEVDFQFHQQMVYAVAMRTIADFERGLERPVQWPWDKGRNRIQDRLRLLPHGVRFLNAYFEPEKGAITFGYSTPFSPGLPPEQLIFSCLSYDIVAHQTLHALHLALLPHYMGVDDRDTAAFLEGLDDLVCILQHFTFPDALLETVVGTHGRINEHEVSLDGTVSTNVLLEIAPQLAQAMGMQGGIRSTLTDQPNPALLETADEPHARGAILGAAFLDAFFTVYRRRTRDLRLIAGGDDRDLNPDLARRLADEAAKTARHFLTIVSRAIDYCPPVGIEFGDFIRAVVTSDAALVTADRWRYREAIILAARARGIFPKGVSSYSDEGLTWPTVAGDEAMPERCTGLDVRAGADNRSRLEPWAQKHRAALGLPGRGAIEIEAVHTRTMREIGGARPGRELVVRIVAGSGSRLRGSTVIIDEHGVLRHVITRASPKATRAVGSGDALPQPVAAETVRSDLAATGRSQTVTPFDRRPLQIFAFDPSRGRSFGNHLTVSVPYEAVKPGPLGAKVAVVDYDATNNRYYDAIDLQDPAIVLAGGLVPTASDPGFHQQMVYAAASATIERFETTLGRPIVWRWFRSDAKGPFANRLLIHPHAMQEANAYYDPTIHGLAFGYFAAKDGPNGRPTGEIVYTCLSHDIVVHETTHALLDAIRRYFLEPTSADAAAFHEAFADVIALLQHFTFPEALLEAVRRTGGRIHQAATSPEAAAGPGGATIQAEIGASNPFVELAREFGEALGTRDALRSALGTHPSERKLETTLEAHDRGAILVAAIFDAFFSVYVRSSADLLRMARAGGAINESGDVRPALAERLAREATDAAIRFTDICIRALDYCPPVDIEFGDFLRAIVTGNWDVSVETDDGTIGALVDAFRSRGIVPRGVASMSEDALRWPRARLADNVRCEGLDPEPRDAADWRKNAARLRDFATQHAAALGLSPEYKFRINQMEAIASQQLDPHGGLSSMIHAQFTQQRREPLVPSIPASPPLIFRGGSTVILDSTGRVRYVIAKPIDDADRLRRQRAFQVQTLMRGVGSAYVAGAVPRSIDLAALHRGY